MPVDIATSPLFVVSNTSGNRIQENATDIVPEQYTLTDSLDNDTIHLRYVLGYDRFGAVWKDHIRHEHDWPLSSLP